MDPRTERMLAERRKERESAPPASATQRGRAKVAAWLPANRFRAAAALAVLAVGVWVAYFALVTLPARQRDRQVAVQREAGRQQAVEDIAQSESLEACLTAAQLEYEKSWDQSCKDLRAAASCTLPSPTANRHEVQRRQAREACVRQYSSTR